MVKLKEYREQRGWSLRQLGQYSGVHYVTLARLEAGKYDPRLSTLLKLCETFHVTIGELLGQPHSKGGQHGRHSRPAKR